MRKISNNKFKRIDISENLNRELIDYYVRWKQRYLRTVENVPKKQQYLLYTFDQPSLENAVSTSESMGYATIIFAMMSKFDPQAKEHFDNSYNFIKMYPSIYNKNLMAWQQIMSTNGDIINVSSSTSSATDGDMDISFGLLLADKLWGSKGEVNYRNEAIKRIKAIMDSCVDKEDYILTLGDWVQGIKENKFKKVTRSSDFMIDHLMEFMRVDRENSIKWQNVIKKIRTIIGGQMSRESKNTGLMPDFFVKSGNEYMAPNTKVLETEHDGDYYFNACRTPFRYSMEIISNGSGVSNQLKVMNNWVINSSKGDPKNIKTGYYIANGIPGNPINNGNDLSFTAPFLVLALINNRVWASDLWNEIVRTPLEQSTFYGNTLKLLSMIVASGNWINLNRK